MNRGRIPVRVVVKEATNSLQMAQQAVAEAERLRAEWKVESLREALEKYQQARVNFNAAGATNEKANTLRNIGEVYSLIGNHQEAQKYYAEALKLSQSSGDRSNQIEVLNDLGSASAFAGKNDQAIAFYQQALHLSQNTNNRLGEARALCLLGEAHYNLNNLKMALTFLNQALTLSTEMGQPSGQAEAHQYLGYVDSDLSNLPAALDHYQKALPLWRTARNLRGEAQTINAMGLVSFLLGEKTQATDYYGQAEQLFRNIGDRGGLVTALNGRGAVYASLGSEQALYCHKEALRLSRETGTLEGQIVALRYLGNAYRRLGDKNKASPEATARQFYSQSIELHTQALALSRVLRDQRIESYTLRDLGDIHDSLGDKKKAIDFFDQAIILSRKVRDRRGEAAILNSRGSIYEAIGARQDALKDFSQALPLARATEDRTGESRALYHLARLHRESPTLAEALSEIEAAVRITETLRIKVISQDLRAAYFASARQYYEVYVEILMKLHQKDPTAGYNVRAFEVSERARARSLLELLDEAHADIRQGVDTSLLERERSLEQALNAKAERHARLVSSQANKDEADALAREIDQLATECDEIKGRIKSTSPRYAALTQPQPLNLVEIQDRLLDENTLLLEYMLGDERSYLWAVSRTEVLSFELPGRSQIEERAHRLYLLHTVYQQGSGETFDQRVERRRQAEAQLPSETAALSEVLLSPIADRLGTKRLLVIADGALQYIPFQALTLPAVTNQRASAAASPEDERRPLILDHEIVSEPSASTLALVLSESANRGRGFMSVAILADPVFEIEDSRIKKETAAPSPAVPASQEGDVSTAFRDVGKSDGGHIPRLPASREEANAIMAVVPWRTGFKALDFDANRAVVTGSDLGQYRIVHFATHALLDNERPELSGIVLSLVDQKGEWQDGFLRLHDIYNLKLPVDLVVLSACQTGLGKDVKGEGLIGLTRGFMYAGASGVVASLWKVDDDATAELMRQFYASMFEKGLTPAAALRDAQLAMRSEKRWQAPYYWAGFVLQGQYNQKENISRPARQLGTAAIGSGIIVAVFVAVFLVRRRRRRIL